MNFFKALVTDLTASKEKNVSIHVEELIAETLTALRESPVPEARRANFDAQAVGVGDAVGRLAELQRAQFGISQHVSQPFVSQPGLVPAGDSQPDSPLRWIQVEPIGPDCTKNPAFGGVFCSHLDFIGPHWTVSWWAHPGSNQEPSDSL
jgi:hypothetical protein